MESAGSHHGGAEIQYRGAGDPDNSAQAESRRPLVATVETVPDGGLSAPRIRISAISDMKEFNGKAKDEDRARSWIGKVKSAFLSDQAPDVEKRLIFGDLRAGPTRNWHSQLSPSTCHSWKDLLENFLVQNGGNGISVGRQYYLAKRRPEDTPLGYLYRLNVPANRAKILIRDGSPDIRREHVEQFFGTLGYFDLAKQLTLLRIGDVDDMEETLRAYQRMEDRQAQSLMEANKFRPRSSPTASPTPVKPSRTMSSIHVEDAESSSESNLSGSDSERELRNVFVAAISDRPTKFGYQRAATNDDREDYSPECVAFEKACTNCGSKSHDDREFWQRQTCQMR